MRLQTAIKVLNVKQNVKSVSIVYRYLYSTCMLVCRYITAISTCLYLTDGPLKSGQHFKFFFLLLCYDTKEDDFYIILKPIQDDIDVQHIMEIIRNGRELLNICGSILPVAER